MHRSTLVLAGVIFALFLFAGLRRSPATAAQGAPSSRARSAAATIPPEGRPRLTADFRLELARRHAPELRFNAWFADGAGSPMNRNEDFYPMSVERFMDALVAREVVVVAERSAGAGPSVARRVRLDEQPVFRDGMLRGYPRDVEGDRPGEAPIYADVYPDPEDARTAYAEFWSFFPMDEGDARAGTVGGLGGHRSDWEHVTLELEVDRATHASAIRSAVYYGHEHALRVDGSRLELVEATHPVVYVSQGKHASYPEPGEWRDYQRLAPLIEYDDVFHGNGERAQTWKGEVVDIAKARRDPPQWLRWSGLWGPDEDRILGITYARSSHGPWFHKESEDRLAWVTGLWENAKATAPGLRCDRDRGFVAPRAEGSVFPIAAQ